MTTTLPTPPDPRLQRMRTLSHLLDSAIPVPGTRFRFGLDAVIGLIPGVGDATGALISGWLVLQAARMGAPATVLARMVGNVVVETIVGAVPLVGDLFDAGWKANRRNMRLLEEHLVEPGRAARVSRGWVIGVAIALLLLLGAAVALVVWLVGALLGALGGN